MWKIDVEVFNTIFRIFTTECRDIFMTIILIAAGDIRMLIFFLLLCADDFWRHMVQVFFLHHFFFFLFLLSFRTFHLQLRQTDALIRIWRRWANKSLHVYFDVIVILWSTNNAINRSRFQKSSNQMTHLMAETNKNQIHFKNEKFNLKTDFYESRDMISIRLSPSKWFTIFETFISIN